MGPFFGRRKATVQKIELSHKYQSRQQICVQDAESCSQRTHTHMCPLPTAEIASSCFELGGQQWNHLKVVLIQTVATKDTRSNSTTLSAFYIISVGLSQLKRGQLLCGASKRSGTPFPKFSFLFFVHAAASRLLRRHVLHCKNKQGRKCDPLHWQGLDGCLEIPHKSGAKRRLDTVPESQTEFLGHVLEICGLDTEANYLWPRCSDLTALSLAACAYPLLIWQFYHSSACSFFFKIHGNRFLWTSNQRVLTFTLQGMCSLSNTHGENQKYRKLRKF